MDRPYQHDDFDSVTALLLEARRSSRVDVYPSVDELRLLIPTDATEAAACARLWPDGFALFDPYWRTLTTIRRDDAVVPRLIDWGIALAATMPPADGRPLLRVRPLDSDAALIAALQEHGFAREDWATLRYRRALSDPIAAPTFPRGFTLRHLGGEAELPEYTALHRGAFGTEYMTVERRLGLMRDLGYEAELDLVAVAPEGELAAFVYCSIDHAENVHASTKQGWTNTIGTLPRYRRLGLATALVNEGLRRLRGRGVDVVYLGTAHDNAALQRVCARTGYELIHTIGSYALS